MRRRPASLATLLLVALCVLFFSRSHAAVQAPPATLRPDNTIILANRVDARFSRDFSTLLKHLRLEWVILDSATVPEGVQDKNLILMGRLDATYRGELIRRLMTAGEIETMRTAESKPYVLEKDSS